MGNNICSCDQKGAEESTTPIMVQKPTTLAENRVINRDNSMAKLLIGA